MMEVSGFCVFEAVWGVSCENIIMMVFEFEE